MVDTLLAYLPSNEKPLKNRTKIRFHTGTSEILGYAILLNREELPPGEMAVVQFRLDAPVAVVKDDRFVIRSYSPIRTIGGGQILDPIPGKHKRFRDSLVSGLANLAEASPEEVITYHVKESGIAGARLAELRLRTNLSEKKLKEHLQNLLSQKTIIQVDRENPRLVHGSILDSLSQKTVKILEEYHKSHPLKAGMSRQGLLPKLSPSLDSRLFNLVIQDLAKTNQVVQDKEVIRLSEHKVALEADQIDVRQKIEQAYLESGLEPPYFRDLMASLGQNSARTKDLLTLMLEEGSLIKVKEDLFFHKSIIDDLRKGLVSYLKANGEITTPQFKEMTGVSRKYTIPLIEFFDTSKVTIRIGDIRKLREG
jgi:selenocysteine-specific elongation factor